MDKIKSALIELSYARSLIACLSKQIGDAMQASYESQTANGGKYTDWIALAYKTTTDDSDWGGSITVHENHDGDVAFYLNEHCQHMLRAHLLIQERKAARKRLGIARRCVTVISNRLAREAA